MTYTIVGAGRIGTALSQMGLDHIVVERYQDIPEGTGPIIVTTRNDDLMEVVHKTPISRREDLLFVQNGMLQSWLKEHDLEDCTQALLYFAVSHKGATPIDGGGSVVNGKWANEFVQLLQQGKIACEVVDKAHYLAQVAEKFLWNCCFGALSQYFNCSVGTLCTEHESSTRALIRELQDITSKHLGVELDNALADRLIKYSLSIYDYRGSIKEWAWRNGWLWEREQSPLHRRYIEPFIAL